MLEGLAACRGPLDWPSILEQSVKSFRETDHTTDNELREALRDVARTGMSVYIDDMGKRGFGGLKHSRFMDAIRRLEDLRRRRRLEEL